MMAGKHRFVEDDIMAREDLKKGMKLKTLKDLQNPEFEDTPYKQCWSDGFNCCLDELRQEAIKRAKHYLSLLEDAKLSCIKDGLPFFKDIKTLEDMNLVGKIAEIVKFNNLKEEELA